MKKVFAVVLIVSALVLLVSCGAGWERTKKNWNSNFDGGLIRQITVTNQLNGEVVWEYTGKSYINSNSSVGDITIIFYNEFGESKKADFIGNFYGVSSVEL